MAEIKVEDRPKENVAESRRKHNNGLPKGVYEYRLVDGSSRYYFTTWMKKGLGYGPSGAGYDTPREAEYMRYLAIHGHHWQNMPEDKDGFFGFTYQMTDLVTGKRYIGSKQLMFWKGVVGGYKCTDPSDEWFDEELWYESDWAEYTSSSKPIKKLIGDEPWRFQYRVLEMATSKLDLHIKEITEQIGRDVLNATDAKGDYMYLNENILGVEYRPPVPKDKLKKSIQDTKTAMRDYYLRPATCDGCGCVIPFGETRCPSAPLFGKGKCADE